MKKSPLLLVALGCSAPAFAQSSITMFGVMDAGIVRASATGAGHVMGLVSGGNTTSRLGFRGTEDLGGGLAAGFWLEGQVNNDVGGGATQTTGLDFVRRSTVSLSGNFGEIRLGRDFAPTYLSWISYDAWVQRGIGAVGNFGYTTGGVISYIRNSNSVTYFLPPGLGGFYGNVQYQFGEQNSNRTAVSNAAGISTSAADAVTDRTGNYFGARAGYASGPLDIAVAYGQYNDAIRTTGRVAAPFYAGDYSLGNLGGAYDFGVVKPMFLLQQEKVSGRAGVAAFKFNTYILGAVAPVGAGLVRIQFARYDNKSADTSANDAGQIALGYIYNLSKRTSLYADVARIKNRGAAVYTVSNMSSSLVTPAPTQGGGATAFAVGIKYSF